MKSITNRNYLHVCGHSDYNDMKTLLIRNKLWSDEEPDYLKQTIAACRGRHSTALPQPSRNVSPKSLNQTFNDVLCIDHTYLGDQCIVHIMYSKTYFSADVISNDNLLPNAIYALRIGWRIPFMTPSVIRRDDAFNLSTFT